MPVRRRPSRYHHLPRHVLVTYRVTYPQRTSTCIRAAATRWRTRRARYGNPSSAKRPFALSVTSLSELSCPQPPPGTRGLTVVQGGPPARVAQPTKRCISHSTAGNAAGNLLRCANSRFRISACSGRSACSVEEDAGTSICTRHVSFRTWVAGRPGDSLPAARTRSPTDPLAPTCMRNSWLWQSQPPAAWLGARRSRRWSNPYTARPTAPYSDSVFPRAPAAACRPYHSRPLWRGGFSLVAALPNLESLSHLKGVARAGIRRRRPPPDTAGIERNL